MSMRHGTRLGWCAALAPLALGVLAMGCSPGTLPGTPSPQLIGGGGGQYNGTITIRRLGGGYTITETPQTLTLSLVLGPDGQMTVRFEMPGGSGTMTGTLEGTLAAGTFQTTMLLTTPAQQGTNALSCEGRGSVGGTVNGLRIGFSAGSVIYDNCPGLSTRFEGEAIAVSPIPGAGGSNRANVTVRILEGTSIAAGTCPDGSAGYPFTVEVAETSGIDFTFDDTFVVEERHGSGPLTTRIVDMPFPELRGGGRRAYGACSAEEGTYQAFFRGTDANGNLVRVASPLVRLGGGGGVVNPGALTGTITNASTGVPIVGAVVTVGVSAAITDVNGAYALANVPAGPQLVQTAAPGYASRTDSVTVAATGTTPFSTSLVPIGSGANISIVLNWGAEPFDLDAYLTGPTIDGEQFTVWYENPNPVPHAMLDVDDRTSFGPETITVSAPGGTFVPGVYEYLVNNFSGAPGFNVSAATVTVFQGGAQLAQFRAVDAGGSPALENWRVFRFTLTATPTGQIAIVPIQQFSVEGPPELLSLRRRK